ncbi:MAG: hypothetical protein ACTSRU_21200 [Candidatus Hodarchaeales archaeon]
MCWEEDIKLLEANGWEVECESPFEIRYEDGGAFASGLAAQIVLDDLKHERDNAFSKKDMHDGFLAGFERGVNTATILTNEEPLEVLQSTPSFEEYMKRYEEEG